MPTSVYPIGKWHHLCSCESLSTVLSVYSANCYMVNGSNMICGIHMNIHPYICLFFPYMVYIPKLVGIFVYAIYLAITCNLYVAAGCILGYICTNVDVYAYLAFWLLVVYLQCCCTYFCNNIYVLCSLMLVNLYVANIYEVSVTDVFGIYIHRC